MYRQRIDRLYQAMRKAGIDAMAFNPSPSQLYLSGLPFHLMERPTVLLLTPEAEPVLILPELEKAKLASAPYPVHGYTYSDDPATWQTAFDAVANSGAFAARTIGIEPNWLRYLELKHLETAFPQARFIAADAVIGELRMQKDDGELAKMRRAVEIAQSALLATLPFIQAGRTERQVAAELTAQLLKHGSDAHLPFTPIVAGGPNSANPHATPSDRPLQTGDLLVIDWGAACDGYIADLTRTFAMGEIDPDMRQIVEVVLQANDAGRQACAPGVQAGYVDRVTRSVIAHAGFGANFIHRTGHGLGLESHEPPYIFAENNLILQPGMTFTIEPGIYLPERGGCRIEDNVVITASGCTSLSDLPRELIQL